MKTVKLILDDTILSDLVAEQISGLKDLKIVTEGQADAIISRTLTQEQAPHLLLGGKVESGAETLPLPLRLGDFNDRLRYILSGRNRFARAETIHFLTFSLNAEDGVMIDHTSEIQIRLTDKEKLIILSLFREATKSLDRHGLLHKVWEYADNVETHTLETHLYRLRQKLEEGFALKDLIVTKDGIYTLAI